MESRLNLVLFTVHGGRGCGDCLHPRNLIPSVLFANHNHKSVEVLMLGHPGLITVAEMWS